MQNTMTCSYGKHTSLQHLGYDNDMQTFATMLQESGKESKWHNIIQKLKIVDDKIGFVHAPDRPQSVCCFTDGGSVGQSDFANAFTSVAVYLLDLAA